MKKMFSKKSLVAASVSVFLAACSPVSTEEHIAEAEKFYAEGNRQAAVIELKNAIKSSPDDLAAREMLGNVYFELGNYNGAQKELSRALTLGGEPSAIVPTLATMHFYVQDFESVLQLKKEHALPKGSDSESRLMLFAFLADSFLNAGQEIAVPDELNAQDKSIADAFSAYAKDDYDQVLSVLAQIPEQNDYFVLTHLLKGLTYAKLDEHENAISHFKTLVEERPFIHFVKYKLLEEQLDTEDLAGATKTAASILKVNKDSPYGNLLMSEIHFRKEEYSEALQKAEKAIFNGLSTKKANVIAGASAFKLEQLEVAHKYLMRADRLPPLNLVAKSLLARVQMALGYLTEAKATFAQFDNMAEIAPELLSDAGMYFAMKGETATAEKLLNQAKSAGENDAEAYLRLGLLKIANDDETGIADLTKAMEQSEDFANARVPIAYSYVEQGKIEEALTIAKEWQESAPIEGLVLEGVIYWRTEDIEKAHSTWLKVLELDPAHLGANLLSISYYTQKQDFEAGKKQIDSALSHHSNDMRIFLGMVRMANRVGDQALNSTIQFLDSYAKEVPEATNAPVALAIAYKAAGQIGMTIETLSALPTLTDFGYMTLGDAYLEQEQHKQAADVFTKWKNKNPDNPMTWLRLIGINQVTENYDTAYELATQASEKFVGGSQFDIIRLALLTELNRLDEAENVLKTLKETTEPTLAQQRYEGELLYKLGQFDEAAPLLKRYYEEFPTFATALSYTKTLAAQNKFEDAAIVLETEYKKLSDTSGVDHTMAEFYANAKDYANARKYYQKAMEETADNFIAMNNLAMIELESGNLSDAKALAQKAVNIRPNIPPLKDTLGWIQYKSGDLPNALKNIGDAYSAFPESEDIAMHYAEVLLEAGNARKAEQVLNSISPTRTDLRAKWEELKKRM
ncbi:PEP-CTERM system TPR-repeat protein PrsT [Aestuariibacter sp. AA17]|uniref:PEP-CTERM system TPR-repeat protein PrsT n=1 Tax=Fluctibacter corallii TaxID=2984329 RepID=A0ABT3ABF3_9ALTE|nr:XrtA/PEP-CTERM system TPR-repeat protein PrsT [Aestuariibacter sp. AA17]MCV2886019.1 PEP-CTERM system TPR-repeat protein PrsT [Aestuariibacter sp. AA17]